GVLHQLTVSRDRAQSDHRLCGRGGDRERVGQDRSRDSRAHSRAEAADGRTDRRDLHARLSRRPGGPDVESAHLPTRFMRLFIATTFPAAAIDPLNARVGAIRSRLPGASWVRPESQHLTFGFLGEQPESIIDTVSAHLTASLAKVPRFEATLHDCGFFPNPRHARVGWMGVEPESGFNEVARAVREAVI